jgi:hypothetical protein
MTRLTARLTQLEKKRPRARQMLGSLEVHSIGGLGHVEGQPCEEHEACVFEATPLPGPIRRMVIGRWDDGMTKLLE